MFIEHADILEIPDIPTLRATIPDLCKACHFHDHSVPNVANTQSIISYSRQPFSLPDNEQPILFATTLKDEAQTVMEWKRGHMTWKSLKSLWDQTRP